MPTALGESLRHLRDRLHGGKRVVTPVVLEGQVWECGVAALAIILGYYGCHVPLEELRREMGISRDGVNAAHIRDAARRYGLKVRVLRCEPERIAQVGFPCIAHLSFIHFVVVEGIHNGRVALNDQGSGPHDVPWHEFADSFTGVAIGFEPGPELQARRRPPSRLRLLLRHTRPAWPALAAALLLSLLYGGALAALALALGARAGPTAPAGTGAALALAGPMLAAGLALLLRGRCLDAAGRALAEAHVPRSLRHVLALPAGYFTLRSSDFVAGRVTAGHHLALLVAGAPGAALMGLPAALPLALALGRAQPPLGLLGLALGGLFAGGWGWVYGRRRSAWRRLRHTGGEAADFTAWRLQNMESTKLAGRDSESFASLAGMQAGHLTVAQEAGEEAARASLIPRAAPAAALALAVALVPAAAGSPGFLSALALAAGLCLSLQGVLRHGRDLPLLGELAGKLDELYAHQAAPLPAPVVPQQSAAAVALEGASFGYSAARPPLLEGVSLHVERGAQVGITGPSGAGKSTLSRLVCGLHAPWGGHLAGAGACALVSGSPALFEGSVRDNVTLWDAAITDGQVAAALKDACLWEWVEAREGGLDAAVRPDGANLSGGQRRRLGIARALARDPALLVLDETLDSLEAPLAEEIRANLRRRGCAVLLVTQRRAILARCDAVYRVAGGRVSHEVHPQPEAVPPSGDTAEPMPPPAGSCASLDPVDAEAASPDGAALAVVRAVARVLPGCAFTVPGQITLRPGCDPVRAVAEASGLFLRRVRLRAPRWWERDNGPLIAFRMGRPVALLPDRGHSYRVLDPAEGKSRRLNASLAGELGVDAYVPYLQPAERRTSFARLLRRGLAAGRCDLAAAAAGAVGLWWIWLALAWLASTPSVPAPGVLAAGLGPAAIGLALAEATAALRLQGRVSLALQPSIWGRVLRLPVSFFRYASPAQIAGWSQQLGALSRRAARLPAAAASAFVGVATGLLLMTRVAPGSALPAAALLALAASVPALCAWRENASERRRFARSVRTGEVLHRLLGDVPGMRLLGADAALADRWLAEYRRERADGYRALGWRRAAGDAPVLATLALLILPAVMAATPEEYARLGFLLAASGAAAQAAAGALASAIRLRPQVERVRSILESPLEREEDAPDIGPLDGSLEASGVSFTYPGSSGRALCGVSLRAGPGEVVAITGPSGSGKSTLLRLLLGFEQAGAGEIRYGGHRLDGIDRDAARRWMDAVLQDEVLPPATIRSHIAGMSSFGLREVWQAARLAGLEEDILAMPMGMQTLGHSEKLSAGQTQRIQIARALLHRPRILFLDETTAGLDREAQAELFARIRSLGITCVVITHRPDMLALSDRIYVMEEGRVVEEGPYADLACSGSALQRILSRAVEVPE